MQERNGTNLVQGLQALAFPRFIGREGERSQCITGGLARVSLVGYR